MITGSESLGTAVASAGEVNGDGLFDILAADEFYNDDAGMVYLYLGSTDSDGDGLFGSGDCDDADPAIGAPTTALFPDADGDTYGDPASSAFVCDDTAGYVSDDTDCDDTSASIHPGASELCDAADADEDCDGATDDDDPDAVGQTAAFLDDHGDGFGGTTAGLYCDLPSGWVATSTDCDDSNASVNPDADEVCNGLDDDCDTVVDTDAIDQPTWYADADGDGYTDPDLYVVQCDVPDGYAAASIEPDCDDTDGSATPALSTRRTTASTRTATAPTRHPPTAARTPTPPPPTVVATAATGATRARLARAGTRAQAAAAGPRGALRLASRCC